jgi:hypothetical protein
VQWNLVVSGPGLLRRVDKGKFGWILFEDLVNGVALFGVWLNFVCFAARSKGN